MSKKTRVKLVVRSSRPDKEIVWRKQTSSKAFEWGNCEFTSDPTDRNYDWLVVVDDVPRFLESKTEELACPKDNTILITSEPENIARYGKAFASQFKYVITNQNKKYLPHKNAIRSQTGNYWIYGKKYDQIIKDKPKKKKKISTICSSKKQGHTMHRRRFNFTAELEKATPELERFGHGVNLIEHKYQAIDDYEFHVVVENCVAPHVWTEKLADTFLGYSVPIYCGAPNALDYFPKNSLIQIDITNSEKAIKEIKKIISRKGEFEKRLPAVKEARRRVIEEYNMLAMIDKIISKDKPGYHAKNKGLIYNRKVMRFKYLPDLFKYIGFRINNFIKGQFIKTKSHLNL